MKLHNDNYLYSPMIGNFLSWFIAFIIMSFYVNEKTDNVWLVIIGMFVGSLWTLWLHAYREAERVIVKEKKINHHKRFFIRSVVAFLIGLLTHFLMDGFQRFGYMTIVKAIACAVYLGTIFWMLFDSFYSKAAGFAWDTIPHGPGQANTDNFFYNKKWLWVLSKIVGFILGIALYYYALRLPL